MRHKTRLRTSPRFETAYRVELYRETLRLVRPSYIYNLHKTRLHSNKKRITHANFREGVHSHIIELPNFFVIYSTCPTTSSSIIWVAWKASSFIIAFYYHTNSFTCF